MMRHSPEYENFKHDAKDFAKASLRVSKSWAKLGRKLTKEYSELAYQKSKEKWQSLADSTRRNIKIALLATPLLVWDVASQSVSFDKKIENSDPQIEQLIAEDESKEEGEMKEEGESVVQVKKAKSQREKLPGGGEILQDGPMYFYKVQEGETLSEIRKKLMKDSRFSYLSDTDYELSDSSRNIQSFNIKSKDLKAGLYIPIPVKKEEREFSKEDFYAQSKLAIQEIKENAHYGEEIKSLLKYISEDRLAKIMTAFARSESTQSLTNPNAPLGEVELQRWEAHLRAFSFSHYHILMEKTADRKSKGPGLAARIKLWLSEGETYHPKNWWKLFLAYWIEKIKTLQRENRKPLHYYFSMDSEEKARSVGKIYNGSSAYGQKLRNNVQFCNKTLG